MTASDSKRPCGTVANTAAAELAHDVANGPLLPFVASHLTATRTPQSGHCGKREITNLVKSGTGTKLSLSCMRMTGFLAGTLYNGGARARRHSMELSSLVACQLQKQNQLRYSKPASKFPEPGQVAVHEGSRGVSKLRYTWSTMPVCWERSVWTGLTPTGPGWPAFASLR